MTDRELLELAAKAAGHKVVRPADYCDGAVMLEGIQEPWNPLEYDHDALRLAVKLNLLVLHDVHIAPVNIWEGEDPYAATRRAIVRAAAEIGRGMG